MKRLCGESIGGLERLLACMSKEDVTHADAEDSGKEIGYDRCNKILGKKFGGPKAAAFWFTVLKVWLGFLSSGGMLRMS